MELTEKTTYADLVNIVNSIMQEPAEPFRKKFSEDDQILDDLREFDEYITRKTGGALECYYRFADADAIYRFICIYEGIIGERLISNNIVNPVRLLVPQAKL